MSVHMGARLLVRIADALSIIRSRGDNGVATRAAGNGAGSLVEDAVNAFILAGFTFFSSLATTMTMYGYVDERGLYAAFINAGYMFFMVLAVRRGLISLQKPPVESARRR